MSKQATRIVIIGAGYAGLMAALRLSGKARRLNMEIVLISGANVFIQRPRLHQVAAGQDVPETALDEMLRGTRVRFLQGWVTAVEPEQHKIYVETAGENNELSYAVLVYALGSVVDQESVPGVRDFAHVLDPHGTNATTVLRKKLLELSQTGGQVVVVGAGPTGIEGATEIKALFPALHVSLVTAGRFAAFKGPRVEKHIRDAFQQQEITVYEGSRVRMVQEQRLLLANREIVPFDICLWAGGFRAPSLASEAGFKVNDRGQILVDPFGRSLSHPDVYAVGDAAHPVEQPGVPMRMSLVTALTRGAHAADNIAARLHGKTQTPLSFAYYGQGIALGPKDAVGFMAYPDDVPRGPILRGKTAVIVRNFFVALIFYFLRLERRWPGLYFWLGRGRYVAAQRMLQFNTSEQPPATV